jgi:hypothetical protein
MISGGLVKEERKAEAYQNEREEGAKSGRRH